ncbi:MAG: transcriptional antiterminator RfaH [Planctomycetota bacterium]|jgi:transcriptional antiterminator RfaH
MKAWYLIHSKPRQESLAQENLERQGYTTYLPVTSVKRRTGRKTGSAVGAMFPRYLFIQLSEKTDDWRPIRSTLGVSSLIRFGQTPAKVPDHFISQIRLREDETGLCLLPLRDYKKGDRVRISEGPFAGYEAIFQSISAKDRVSILLELIQSSIHIELEQGFVEPNS